jgi:hypothetical protein
MEYKHSHNNNKNWSNFTALALVFAIALTDCGPVNSEQKTSNPNNLLLPVSAGATQVSQKKYFYVYVTRKNSENRTPNSSSRSSKIEVGDNEYLIRFAHCEDLQAPSNNATIDVTYWMPDMPDMGKSEVASIQQSDGSFLVTLFFSMPGRWEMTLKIKNGSIQDAYVFETKF